MTTITDMTITTVTLTWGRTGMVIAPLQSRQIDRRCKLSPRSPADVARVPPDLTILPIALAACAIGVDAVLGKLLSFTVVTLGTFGVLAVAATLAGFQAKGDWLEEQGNLITVLVLVLIAIGVVVCLNLVRLPSVRARGLLAGALEGCLMAVETRRRILGVLRPRSDVFRQC